MKKILVLVSMLIASCSMTAMAANIGVVNMKDIFSTSPQVKQIKADLTKRFAPQKDQLEGMGKKLQTDIDQYQKNQTVMKKKDLNDMQSKISTEEMSFRQAQAKFQQDLFTAQNDALESFMKTVKAAVNKVAAKNKLDLVLPANDVLYNSQDLDITKEVLANMAS